MYVSLPLTALIRQARQGIPRRRVDEVARLANLTDKEMAPILAMSVRGLHGKNSHERLSLAASERLLLLERLLRHGLSVFDNRTDLLSRWLRTPLGELGYREGIGETDIDSPVRLSTLGSFSEPASPHNGPSAETPPPSVVVAQSPLAVLDTVSGFALADDVLGRIEWGIVG